MDQRQIEELLNEMRFARTWPYSAAEIELIKRELEIFKIIGQLAHCLQSFRKPTDEVIIGDQTYKNRNEFRTGLLKHWGTERDWPIAIYQHIQFDLADRPIQNFENKIVWVSVPNKIVHRPRLLPSMAYKNYHVGMVAAFLGVIPSRLRYVGDLIATGYITFVNAFQSVATRHHELIDDVLHRDPKTTHLKVILELELLERVGQLVRRDDYDGCWSSLYYDYCETGSDLPELAEQPDLLKEFNVDFKLFETASKPAWSCSAVNTLRLYNEHTLKKLDIDLLYGLVAVCCPKALIKVKATVPEPVGVAIGDEVLRAAAFVKFYRAFSNVKQAAVVDSLEIFYKAKYSWDQELSHSAFMAEAANLKTETLTEMVEALNYCIKDN